MNDQAWRVGADRLPHRHRSVGKCRDKSSAYLKHQFLCPKPKQGWKHWHIWPLKHPSLLKNEESTQIKSNSSQIKGYLLAEKHKRKMFISPLEVGYRGPRNLRHRIVVMSDLSINSYTSLNQINPAPHPYQCTFHSISSTLFRIYFHSFRCAPVQRIDCQTGISSSPLGHFCAALWPRAPRAYCFKYQITRSPPPCDWNHQFQGSSNTRYHLSDHRTEHTKL